LERRLFELDEGEAQWKRNGGQHAILSRVILPKDILHKGILPKDILHKGILQKVPFSKIILSKVL
jgi:uncharacterized protein YjbI with pentapeptide repeats